MIITYLVQIVSESFPISSSGHINVWLCVMQYFNLPSYEDIALLCSNETFMHLLHIPTIAIVVIFFKSYWIKIFQRWHSVLPLVIRCIIYSIVADSITIIAYVLYKKFNFTIPLWIGFTITAALLYSLKYTRHHTTKPRLSHMVILGFVQSIALLPGISRFGSVFVAARWLGIRTDKAFAITWMLQFPLMVGAAGLSIIKALQGHTPFFMPVYMPLFWMVITIATFLGFLGLWISYRLASAHKLWILSFYMLIPIALSLFFCY